MPKTDKEQALRALDDAGAWLARTREAVAEGDLEGLGDWFHTIRVRVTEAERCARRYPIILPPRVHDNSP